MAETTNDEEPEQVPVPVPVPAGGAGETTYLLLDGENLDATLGNSVLGGRKPEPYERPRWDRVLRFAEEAWGRPVKALFFINATSGHLALPFIQALHGMGIRPVPLSGPPGMKVVDEGITRTLRAIAERPGNVLLGTHDADFLPEIEALLEGDRQVGLLAFREFVNGDYMALRQDGLQLFDLEDDARAFNQPLPRIRIIAIEDFDPAAYL